MIDHLGYEEMSMQAFHANHISSGEGHVKLLDESKHQEDAPIDWAAEDGWIGRSDTPKRSQDFRAPAYPSRNHSSIENFFGELSQLSDDAKLRVIRAMRERLFEFEESISGK